MKIVCDACQAKYSISDDKVQGKVFKIRCKKCNHAFVPGGGLALALLAARRGWRPAARRMIFGSVVAVIALMLIPPVDNGDPLYYAAYGRLAVLGHSPYVPKPLQWIPAADPVRLAVPIREDDPPSRIGLCAGHGEVSEFRECVAGAGGFEPPYGGIKIRCLTTWLRPTGVRVCYRHQPSRSRTGPYQSSIPHSMYCLYFVNNS